MHNRTFRPHWIPTLAAAAGLVLFVNLGLWQSGKGEKRAAEIAQHAQRAAQGALQMEGKLLQAQEVQDFPVSVRGVFAPEQQFFIDNRQENGKPGVHVITPLRITGSQTMVLVNRGWVGWGDSRAVLPSVPVPAGEVQVSGLASVPSMKQFFLMPDHPEERATLWIRVDLQRFAQQSSHPVQPFVILQNDESARDDLVRHWPPPEDRVAMHESYALQWFSMAVGLLVFWFVASLRKKETA
jgi:surfeit locus 1 family protein